MTKRKTPPALILCCVDYRAQQLAMVASLLRASFQRLTVRMFYAYRARRRMAFVEVVGGHPRHRAGHMRPPLTERSERKWSGRVTQH